MNLNRKGAWKTQALKSGSVVAIESKMVEHSQGNIQDNHSDASDRATT